MKYLPLLPLLLLLGPAAALADCPGIEISGAWVREPPPGASGSAGYLKVRNTGASAVVLSDWGSERFEKTMLHETVQVGDRSSMRHLASLEVPPEGTATLAPGGLHLMLMGPRGPLSAGALVPFTVACGGGSLKFEAKVQADGMVQP